MRPLTHQRIITKNGHGYIYFEKRTKNVTREGEETLLAGKGRHDPCTLPRAVPIVDAMVALVLCDHLLRQHGQCKVL